MNDKSPKRARMFSVVGEQADRPGKRNPTVVAAEFIRHLEAGKPPQEFPGLVTTKPPTADAQFVWLTGVLRVKYEVACPWCSQHTPKFKHGRLCYFAEEEAFRFVGWQCAVNHLDEKQLKEANKKWKEQQRRTARDQFLRDNCKHVASWVELTSTITPIVGAAEFWSKAFVGNESGAHSELGRYIRGGMLTVDQQLGPGARRDGQMSISVGFAFLSGASVFGRKKLNLSKKLELVRGQLKSIATEAQDGRNGEIAHMSQTQRDMMCVIIETALRDLLAVIERVRDIQLFLQGDNIELLNRWCSHDKSEAYEAAFDFRLDGRKLRIGYRDKNRLRRYSYVTANDALSWSLPTPHPITRNGTV